MIEVGKKITTIGVFTIRDIIGNHVLLDPFEKGGVEITQDYEENGFDEISRDGTEKEFDGFQKGDFFKFNGKYEVVFSSDLSVSVQLEGYYLSFPVHKVLEVE